MELCLWSLQKVMLIMCHQPCTQKNCEKYEKRSLLTVNFMIKLHKDHRSHPMNTVKGQMNKEIYNLYKLHSSLQQDLMHTFLSTLQN